MPSGRFEAWDGVKAIALLGVLMVAWLGRLYALGDDSLWGDEIFSLGRALQDTIRDAWAMIKASNHPPMYERGILYPWLKLGDQEFFLRFPSAWWGTLTVAVIYALGCAAFGVRVGILSALFVALSPLHVYYSREARMYALLACLVTFEIYCLHKALRSPAAGRYWLGFTLFATLSLYTHYYAAFTLWALTGFMLIRLAVDWDFAMFKRWVAASLGIAAMFSPWILMLRLHLQNQPVDWIQPISLPAFLQMPAYFFARREVLPERTWPIVLWGVWAALVSCVFGLIARSYVSKRWRGWLLVGGGVGTFLVAFWISVYKPLIVARYFTGILPVMCLLVAFGASYIRPRYVAAFLCAVLLAVSAFSSYRVSTLRWQEDWRAVAHYIERRSSPGDVILLFFPITPEFWRIPFDYYYGGDLRVFCLQGVWARANKAAILARLVPYTRVWVVQSARFTPGDEWGDSLGEAVSATHQVLFNARFDDRIILADRVVDVVCLKPLESHP